MEIHKFKVNDVVRVTRPKTAQGPKNGRQTIELPTAPTVGRIVWVHPQGIFYVVEFRDRYTAAYRPMYRESFYPDKLEKINRPDFFETRPAKQRRLI